MPLKYIVQLITACKKIISSCAEPSRSAQHSSTVMNILLVSFAHLCMTWLSKCWTKLWWSMNVRCQTAYLAKLFVKYDTTLEILMGFSLVWLSSVRFGLTQPGRLDFIYLCSTWLYPRRDKYFMSSIRHGTASIMGLSQLK